MVDRSAAGKRPGYRPAVPVLEARPVPDARPGYGAQRPVATTVRFAVRLNKNLLRRLRAVGAAALLLAVIAPAAASAAPLPGAVPGAAPTPASTGSAATTGQAPTAGQSYGTSVSIRGHGFGHGEGMGQWGAYGYAIQGSTWQQILAHYYGNTAFGTGSHPPEGLNVRLQALDDRPHTSFVQDNGLMATLADNGAGRFRSLTMVETATAGYYAVYGRNDAAVCPGYAAPFNPAGWTWSRPPCPPRRRPVRPAWPPAASSTPSCRGRRRAPTPAVSSGSASPTTASSTTGVACAP